MKKIYDDEKEEQEFQEQEFQEFDRTKLIVTVIPVCLILLVLAVTLILGTRKEKVSGTEQLQQDIMNYADKTGESEERKEDRSDAANGELSGREKDERSEGSATVSAPAPAPTAEPTPTPYKPIMEKAKIDYSKIQFDDRKNLEEMMAYWAENNQQALDDLANLDWFRAMSWSLRDTEKNYYYGAVNAAGKPEGMGIAVYGDDQYYYGEWENGMRSGKGTWIHYHFHEQKNTGDLYTYHQYVGMWKDDLPEGEGQEHYDLDPTMMKEGNRYINNRIGTYKNGFVSGKFYLTSIDDQDNMEEWEANASEGKWLYYGENKDSAGRRPAYLELNPANTEDNYIWLSSKENVNINVPCLISQNKN